MDQNENEKKINDTERILALALIKYLYNKGKISELVYRNIKKDEIKKIAVEHRGYVC